MVLWGYPDTVFGLQSSCPEIESRAAEMFAAWAIPAGSSPPDFCWGLESDGNGFRLSPPANYKALDPEFELPGDTFEDLDTALLNIEFQAVAALIGRLNAPLHMHGALLVKDGRATGLIGAKESGKSTLSTYLWLNGWEMLADDGFCFQEGRIVRPVPRRIRLRDTFRQLLPGLLDHPLPSHQSFQKRKDGSLLIQPEIHKELVELERVILLKPEEGDLEQLDSARATLEFLAHTNSYRIHGINKTLAALSSLLEGMACYSLGRAPLAQQHERLSRLCSRS